MTDCIVKHWLYKWGGFGIPPEPILLEYFYIVLGIASPPPLCCHNREMWPNCGHGLPCASLADTCLVHSGYSQCQTRTVDEWRARGQKKEVRPWGSAWKMKTEEVSEDEGNSLKNEEHGIKEKNTNLKTCRQYRITGLPRLGLKVFVVTTDGIPYGI